MVQNFSKKATPSTESGDVTDKEEKPFVRDNTDNKLFKDIQVKDISPIITDDCLGIKDSDTMIWKACANMETKYIRVTHKTEGVVEDLPNITTFRGGGKKIAQDSWLGQKNIDRELAGLDPWKVEDFKVEELQKLNYPEDKAIEQAKIQIHLKLKQERLQYGVSKIIMVIGEGDNFRNDLPLCRKYKGNRKPAARPVILKQIRKWAVEDMGAIVAKPRADGKMVEADDVVEYYGALGYANYRKTGKFNYVVLASDKDAKSNPKLLIDPDTYTGKNNPLQGQFKFPQAMLIEATDVTCGDLEKSITTSGSEVKGYGFKWLMYQALLGQDSADNYNALGHLIDSGYNLNFGDESAYAVLKPCNTAQECLQAAIDTCANLLPYGVEYKDFTGNEHDVDTLTYLNNYFLTAYMLRHDKDTMDLFKLCKAFKVDTSKVTNNNVFTAPYEVVDTDNAVTSNDDWEKAVGELLNTDLKAYKSDKKDGLVARLDKAVEVLTLRLAQSTTMKTKFVQRNKKTDEVVVYVPN